LTCEEASGGQVWESDPLGRFAARRTQIGAESGGGKFESVAYDNRTASALRFFVTEDDSDGALRRFTPLNAVQRGAASILESGGTTHWLVLSDVEDPNEAGVRVGTFTWSTDEAAARKSASDYYSNSEGIDFRPMGCTASGCIGRLYFTAKASKTLVTLFIDAASPDTGVAHLSSTVSGAFNNQPDQIAALVGHSDLLYFCEDGGTDNGVHARDGTGRFYTILDGYPAYPTETTGLAFSPDKKHMYVAFQGGDTSNPGRVFDIFREDGLPFGGETLDIKYHENDIN
jgi:hypothetical protein